MPSALSRRPYALSRREVVRGLAVGVPLAAILADPLLARAAADGLETVTITTRAKRQVSGALALPAKTPAPTVLLLHDWWGLSDQIKGVAADFARQGYLALALDLYEGRVATNPDDARAAMRSVAPGKARDTVAAWARWLKSHPKGTGKIGTVGWSFGGWWSLSTGIVEPVDATVVYYGRVSKKAKALAKLRGPVLGHFAETDKWINRAMVSGFEREMRSAGKPFTNHVYAAEHGFANATSPRYDKAASKLAWERTLKFFAANLR